MRQGTETNGGVRLTPNEIKALQGILDSEFHDGADPVNNPVWSWSANPFDSKRTFGGVVASLQKKGLAIGDGGGGNEACIQITQAGLDALNKAKADQQRWGIKPAKEVA